jgi:hypothetical protein
MTVLTVYIVTIAHWEDTEIWGVFSSPSDAEACVAAMDVVNRANAAITAWAVN